MSNCVNRLMPLKFMTILIAMVLSVHAYAGCDSGEGVCKITKGQEHIVIGCQVNVCASANDYMIQWDLVDGTQVVEKASSEQEKKILIDGESGSVISEDEAVEAFTCYGLNGSEVNYCMAQPEF